MIYYKNSDKIKLMPNYIISKKIIGNNIHKVGKYYISYCFINNKIDVIFYGNELYYLINDLYLEIKPINLFNLKSSKYIQFIDNKISLVSDVILYNPPYINSDQRKKEIYSLYENIKPLATYTESDIIKYIRKKKLKNLID